MPRVKSPKSTIIALRLNPRIAELVSQVASNDGMNVSEWIRTLIVEELKRRGLLPMATPSLEVEGVSAGGGEGSCSGELR
jgi:hypothetical protein